MSKHYILIPISEYIENGGKIVIGTVVYAPEPNYWTESFKDNQSCGWVMEHIPVDGVWVANNFTASFSVTDIFRVQVEVTPIYSATKRNIND